MLNEKFFDRIWCRAWDILGWEIQKSGNLAFLISYGGSYKKCAWELKGLQCPGNAQQQRKLLVQYPVLIKWLLSLKTLSLGVGTLRARNQQQEGVLINERWNLFLKNSLIVKCLPYHQWDLKELRLLPINLLERTHCHPGSIFLLSLWNRSVSKSPFSHLYRHHLLSLWMPTISLPSFSLSVFFHSPHNPQCLSR